MEGTKITRETIAQLKAEAEKLRDATGDTKRKLELDGLILRIGDVDDAISGAGACRHHMTALQSAITALSDNPDAQSKIKKLLDWAESEISRHMVKAESYHIIKTELSSHRYAVNAEGKNPATSKAPAKNPWMREHLNLTEQGRIFKESPIVAKRLEDEAIRAGKHYSNKPSVFV